MYITKMGDGEDNLELDELLCWSQIGMRRCDRIGSAYRGNRPYFSYLISAELYIGKPLYSRYQPIF